MAQLKQLAQGPVMTRPSTDANATPVPVAQMETCDPRFAGLVGEFGVPSWFMAATFPFASRKTSGISKSVLTANSKGEAPWRTTATLPGRNIAVPGTIALICVADT